MKNKNCKIQIDKQKFPYRERNKIFFSFNFLFFVVRSRYLTAWTSFVYLSLMLCVSTRLLFCYIFLSNFVNLLFTHYEYKQICVFLRDQRHYIFQSFYFGGQSPNRLHYSEFALLVSIYISGLVFHLLISVRFHIMSTICDLYFSRGLGLLLYISLSECIFFLHQIAFYIDVLQHFCIFNFVDPLNFSHSTQIFENFWFFFICLFVF